MKTWELCPKCNGTGIGLNGSNINGYIPCDVCNGEKIISIFTGRPPKVPSPNRNSNVFFSKNVINQS